MSAGHTHADTFDGMNDDYKRRLIIVTVVNIAMFVVEMTAGQLSGSQALKADALDFFADGITYALSFWAIGKALSVRATAALAKGISLVVMGLWIAGSTLYQIFVFGLPEAEVMGVIGLLALGANVFTVWLLFAYKDGDANIRSVWLCSRNDAIGNVAVVIAAVLVWWSGSSAPDLVVAGIMSVLFLWSAWQILTQSVAELKHAREDERAGHRHDHDDHAGHTH
jgi:Co/Zn/Cd efflux system component